MTKVNEPIMIGRHKVKNRITMAPTVKFDYTDDSGKVTPALVEHYKTRAQGGVGLICIEATAVTPDGRFCHSHMGLWADDQIEGHKAITAACHAEDVTVIIQLNHAGSGSFPDMGEAKGPSDITIGDKAVRGMSLEELHDLQQAYIDAAVRAQKAGYDGVQLHGCHGYMINAFMSPYTNLRTDEYGGDEAGRARFGKEIIAGIRKACGPDFLISIRIAGAEPTAAASIQMAEDYVAAGCDYLQVSFGTSQSFEPKTDEAFSYTSLRKFGQAFYQHFKGRVPVSLVGGILTPEDAREIIETDQADTIDLARGMLADGNLANAILSGADYVKCFDCAGGCQYSPFKPHKCPAALKRGKNACD